MGNYAGMTFGVHKGFSGSMHWHPEVEMLFVVEGAVKVKVQEHTVELKEDDVVLINSSVMHAMDAGEDALFCLVKYPWRMLSELIGSSDRSFLCSSVEDTSRSYAEIRSIFRALAAEYARQNRRSDCLIDSLLLRLLSELIEHFLVEHRRESAGKVSEEMRLQQIVQMVNYYFNNFIGRILSLISFIKLLKQQNFEKYCLLTEE